MHTSLRIYLYATIRPYVCTGEPMSEDTIPYENMEDFYTGIKKDIPEIMGSFSKEDKVKRTISVPKVFDTVFHRKIRADLLRFHGVELNYRDLLVGFAMIGLATWTSDNVVKELVEDVDVLNAIDETRKRKRK